jgi:MFS family permease
MFGPYLEVLRRPGAWAMSSAGFVARLPISMIGLGVVLLVSLQTGSYALAGALSATEALANAAVGPLLGRAIDRNGQHRVLPLLTGGHIAALILFVVLVERQAPVPLLFAAVAVQGGLMPNIGALIRARWAFLLVGEPLRLRTAFAYESVMDEAIFVVGPPVATVLAISLIPWGTLAACALLLGLGVALLVPQRNTEPPRAQQSSSGQGSALRYPGLLPLVIVFILLGGLFGSFEVVTVAFADEAGIKGLAGVLLALYSVSSAAAGLALGAMHLTVPLHRQLLVTTAALALATLPFPFIGSPWLLAVVALLSGLACSPVLISAFALTERLVPNARLTEGLIWTNAGLGLGIAFAAAGAGYLIDQYGASTAYFISAGCALGTFVAVLVAFRSLDRVWLRFYGPDAGTTDLRVTTDPIP